MHNSRYDYKEMKVHGLVGISRQGESLHQMKMKSEQKEDGRRRVEIEGIIHQLNGDSTVLLGSGALFLAIVYAGDVVVTESMLTC